MNRQQTAWYTQKRLRGRRKTEFSVSLVVGELTVTTALSTVEDVLMTAVKINDGFVGASSLALSGADAADFTLTDGLLYLNSGTVLGVGVKRVQIDLTNDAVDRVGQTRSKIFTLNIVAP